MSTIAAGTTSGTALVSTGNTSGELQLQVNGTTPSVTLAANGSIGVGSSPSYGTNGQLLTSSGTGSAPTWTTVSTPSSGLAKVWIKCDAAGAILGSYNVTSITDVATGKVAVTIATDFSSTNYVIVGTSVAGADDCYISVDGTGTGGVDPTAGSFRGINRDPQGVARDPAAYMFACFGDQ